LLDTETFKVVVASTPLVSIDLIVERKDGHILVGLRRNRPAMNCWFVPGGRIRKNETMDQAFSRVCEDELGFSQKRSGARFIGVHEHFYDDSVFGGSVHCPSTHYLALAFHLRLKDQALSLPTGQHRTYKWESPDQLLISDLVHPYVKEYIQGLRTVFGSAK
jgi:colanic acid biosynthesis protein WcaH